MKTLSAEQLAASSDHPVLKNVFYGLKAEAEAYAAWSAGDWSGDWNGGQWSGGEWTGGDWNGGDWGGGDHSG